MLLICCENNAKDAHQLLEGYVSFDRQEIRIQPEAFFIENLNPSSVVDAENLVNRSNQMADGNPQNCGNKEPCFEEVTN